MTIQELKGTTYTIECLTKDEQKRIELLLKENGYKAFLGELGDTRAEKYLTVYEDLDVCRTECKRSSLPIYKSTEITDNNMQQQQTLKRKRLVELHNLYTCSTWRENIVEILDLAGPLATDDTDIVIPQAKIDLLIKQGSKAQKDSSGLKLTNLKVGDWVCIIQQSHSKGHVFQLTEDNFKRVSGDYDISYVGCSWSFPNQVRLATKEEISKVTCQYKVGDYLVCLQGGWNNSSHPDYIPDGAFDTSGNRIQKIVKIEFFEDQLVAVGHLGGVARIERWPNWFRLATQDEIDQVGCPYKDGELIWVWDNVDLTWKIRYATGKISGNRILAYDYQKNSGGSTYYEHHQKATGIILPPNPCK